MGLSLTLEVLELWLILAEIGRHTQYSVPDNWNILAGSHHTALGVSVPHIVSPNR